MPLSNFLTNTLLTSYFESGTPYVALYSSNPGNDGTAGVDVTNDIRTSGRVLASFTPPAGRAVTNDANVEFGNAAGAATVTHFGLWSEAVGGNYLGGDALLVSRTIALGDPVAFLIGDLEVSLPG
jgi:hypothetical protein